jgi:DNA-binding CsgD family transcriptional regulator
MSETMQARPSAVGPVFVGRGEELTGLRAAIAAACSGAGGIVLLTGEPGIGKTRLAEEATAGAGAPAVRVLWGRCWDGGVTPPFWPWLQILQHVRVEQEPGDRWRERDGLQALDGLAPALRRYLPGGDDAWPVPELPAALAMPQLPPGTARFRLFEEIAGVLRGVAEHEPLVLVLDDLHWADADSLALLRFLAHTSQPPNLLATLPVLAVGTYRPEEVHRNTPLADLLADLERERRIRTLALAPFSHAELSECVTRLGGSSVAPTVTEAIAAQTEGNPFFVDELVRHLLAGGWDLADPRTAAVCERVPDGVRHVIERRLARLSPAASRLAQAAAVLGEGCSFDLIEATLATAEDRASAETPELDALDETLAAGILREDAGSYRFRHPLIRLTLYEGLSAPRRQRLHRRAGEAIERLHARNLTPHLAALATHFREGGAAVADEKVIDYCLRAGEAAWALLAFTEATAHWQTALSLMEAAGVEPLRRADLLKRLGEVEATTGATTVRGVSYLERAIPLYEQAGEHVLAAHLHVTVGGHYCSAVPDRDIERGFEHFRRARAVLERSADPADRSHLEIGVAFAAVFALRTAEGLAASSAALELSEQTGQSRDQINATVINAWHLAADGRLAVGLAQMERALERAAVANDALMIWRAAGWRGHWALFLADPRDAAAWFSRGLARPRIEPASVAARNLTRNLTVAHVIVGDLVEARRLLPAAREQPLTNWSAEPWLAWADGDWEQAVAQWSGVLEQARRTGDRWGQVAVGGALAVLQRVLGEPAAAEALLGGVLRACDGPFVVGELRARALLALICAEDGRVEAAQAQLARCRAILAAGEDWRGLMGYVALAEGGVAAANGRWHEAQQRFGQAITLFRRFHLVWDEAEALLCRGRCLLAARERGQAEASFAAAREQYQQIGAGTAWLQRVDACAGTAAASASGPLSAREVEVLRLIAAGESNPAIAERLVLSIGTVARHTANIYAKIGARGRADAVAYALRHGLIDA